MWETKVEIPLAFLRLTRSGSFLLHVYNLSKFYLMDMNRLAPGS
jgi:hypothetical protein